MTIQEQVDTTVSGVAVQTLALRPLNGLRHLPSSNTSGWYVWGGEYDQNPGFFQPLHTRHLIEKFPELAELFAMPPGSRWLLDGLHIDRWFDKTLLVE